MNLVLYSICAALVTLSIGLALGVILGRKNASAARKARKTSNLVLIALGVFALVFIVTMIVVFCIKGSVPDTLIQYTLGAGGVEAVALSAIRIAKAKYGTEEESE